MSDDRMQSESEIEPVNWNRSCQLRQLNTR